MEDTRLPRHVIDRLEHRWASRLQQDLKTWSSDKSRPAYAHHVHTDGARVIPVIVKRVRDETAGVPAPKRRHVGADDKCQAPGKIFFRGRGHP